MSKTMMKCGHTAQGHRVLSRDPLTTVPVCVICSVTEQAPPPDLTGRKAKCCSKKTVKPSSFDLPFFEFRGEGSPAALTLCRNCGFRDVAHERKKKGKKLPYVCDNFERVGVHEYDHYYCGCRGWD